MVHCVLVNKVSHIILTLQREWAELHRIWGGRMALIYTPNNIFFKLPMRCLLSKPDRIKFECGQKLRPNFALSAPL